MHSWVFSVLCTAMSPPYGGLAFADVCRGQVHAALVAALRSLRTNFLAVQLGLVFVPVHVVMCVTGLG